MKTAYKLFNDPQLAEEGLAVLAASGYSASAIGVLVRAGEGAEGAALPVSLREVGTLEDVGPVAAAGADVLGLKGEAGADVSADLAAALGLGAEALSMFSIGLMRGGVLVAVQTSDEGLAKARQALRSAEPVNVRIPKQRNEGFELADRQTNARQSDKQFSGDFRKY
ncbi:MAG: hypothetical protein ACYC1C_15995 [Chloroflexota bacterium]